MQEDDDWLDGKVSGEMLESWLGIRQKVFSLTSMSAVLGRLVALLRALL